MTLEPVLVTGGAGFIGGALVARLRRDGLAVVGVSSPRRALEVAGLVTCDLRAADDVERLFREHAPATVLHMASHVTGVSDLDTVLSTFRDTLETTVNVLVAAARTGTKRVVLAGSMETLPSELPARYPYAAAKRASEVYAGLFQSAFGLSTATARIGMVYGPGQRAYARLVPHVILSQLRGQRPRLSSGRRVVDWVYIDDVVDAFLALAAAPATAVDGNVLDVGSGTRSSAADVARLLTRITQGPEPELGALPDRALDPDVALDVAATERVLGWRARVGLEVGLERTVAWYREELDAGRV